MNRHFWLIVTVLIVLPFGDAFAQERKEKTPWPYWERVNNENTAIIVHDEWDYFLRRNVVPHANGHHLIRFYDVSPKDKELLNQYIKKLQSITITNFNKDEQLAYWLNLYNAGLIKAILDQKTLPKNVNDIDLSSNFFIRGPWEEKIFTIEDKQVSLDDIRHRILRPLWNDAMINYGLFCGAEGCPDIQYEAFTSKNTFFLLNRSASYFINHPRGVLIDQEGQLVLSSFYKWYGEDFITGNESKEQAILKHINQFADEDLKQKMNGINSIHRYDFSWALNVWKNTGR